jgi:hypothetical protein
VGAGAASSKAASIWRPCCVCCMCT